MVESLEREIEGLRSLLHSRTDPDGRAFVPLADAYRRSKDLDRALEALAEGLERHPDFASAHVVAARVHEERGDVERARAAWSQVLALDEENIRALRGLAFLHLDAGERDAARPLLRRLRRLDPDDTEVRERLEAIEPHAPRTAGAEWPADTEVPASPFDAVPVGPPASAEAPVSAAAAEALLGGHEILDVWSPEPVRDEEEPSAELPATRTMAELFARQGFHARAAAIYERLLEAEPDDRGLRERLEALRERVPSEGGDDAGSRGVHDDDTEAIARDMSAAGREWVDPAGMPFAWGPDDPVESEPEDAGEPIARYLERLLDWEPGAVRDETGPPPAHVSETLDTGDGAGPWKDPPGGALAAAPPSAAEGSALPEAPAAMAPGPFERSGGEAVSGEPLATVPLVPIESLAPDRVPPMEPLAPDAVVPIESLAPSPVVPIASLAPDAVPIESLAPGPDAGGPDSPS